MTHDTQTITAGVSRAITAGIRAGGYQTQAIRDALLAEFVVIPRADLPEVEDRGGARLLVAEYTYSRTANPRELRDEAIRRIAIAEYLERREAEEAVAEERRNKRRDELAADLSGVTAFRYSAVSSTCRAAIERIIDMEEEAAK